MKNRRLALVIGVAAVALVTLAVLTARPAGEQQIGEPWEFVMDVEVRDPDDTPIALQVVRAGECVPDAETPDGCAVSWTWPEIFLEGNVEWYYPRFEVTSGGALTDTVPVAVVDYKCPVDLELCAVHDSDEPSGECLTALAACGTERDGRGYYNNGPVSGGGEVRHGVFYVPLASEWWETCPVPPPTATPYVQPTYTPAWTYTPLPLPTCLPTPTPNPTPTPLPSSTPYPTELPWPTQPPWE